MNYEQFLQKLKQSNFNVIGLSFAFCEFGEWQISFIRFGGKYQTKGEIAFVICARPLNVKTLENKIVKESRNPKDYPFKLILSEIDEELIYQPKLLNFELEYFERDSDWSRIYEVLRIDLPKLLVKLGVDELKKQIRSQQELSYIEKIWLEE